jgi:hypothetical protein
MNGYFDSNSHKVDALLMNGMNKKSHIIGYEWYEIIF